MGPLSNPGIATIALLSLAAIPEAIVPMGGEFRVDTRGSADPSRSGARTLAVTPDGGFLMTWSAESDVRARKFDSSGVGMGPDFVVNTDRDAFQEEASLCVAPSGAFLVLWTTYQPAYQAIRGQNFDASGEPLGGEFVVRDSASGTGGTHYASCDASGSNGFVVAWMEYDGPGFANVMAQRLDGTGAPIGGEFLVNDTTGTATHDHPMVASDDSGGFVVVWTRLVSQQSRVLAKRFTAAGLPIGAEFEVASGTGRNRVPSVARKGDGSFVVAWANNDDVAPPAILARRFDPAGTPLGPAAVVSGVAQEVEGRTSIDIDSDGDFVVSWGDRDGDDAGIFAARFHSSGTPVGPVFQVNTYTTGPQLQARVASDPAGNFVVTWFSSQGGLDGLIGRRYAAGLAASGLAVDAAASPSSDGNGVLEAGETVEVAPTWLNANFAAQSFTGSASGFGGPGTPGDPAYAIADGAASYGSVPANAAGSCLATADCYALGISVPTSRPAAHWDAQFDESIAPGNLGAAKTWTLHVGDSFADVPRPGAFYRFVETLLHYGVTAGCGPGAYCPSPSTTRGQMAVFVVAASDGAQNPPPACVHAVFGDVPSSHPFCPWIQELNFRGVVAGCGGGNYCPDAPVTREQMAVFVLRTLDPTLTPPACVAPTLFADVPETSGFCPWIEELARRNVVTGCGGGNYCPTASVTREQMAVFIAAGFGLQLYGP
jgi:hypothetical protein